ncbi:hypothetical protein [Holophaga foetida]|uniref:hypothetical protein n=1 Tax=Holophaga foetida TaxID=35839 RepID=UPI0002472AF3|nr:hypothetical protein [Holophaga foetida]
MRKSLVLVAGLAILAFGAGCAKKTNPILPRKPVPAGTVEIQFTKTVQGPLDLTLDGTRIPVQQNSKKGGLRLIVSGLTPGKHRFVLISPLEAFGPDQGEWELQEGKGLFQVFFAQHFNATLYGKSEELPPAPGLPGVKARLEKK